MTDIDPFKLIAQGYAIFPVDPSDKRPVAADRRQHPVNQKWEYEVPRLKWGTLATTDEAQIQKWVSEYPRCKWGIPTGVINGFITVDEDSEEAIAWWDAKWLPSGKEVETASGNQHIYYGVDEGLDIQTNKGKIHPSIDIRGEGGYVVAYTDDMSGIPPIPPAVIELLPERQTYEVGEVPDVEPPAEMSEAEKRVLKGITDRLDALPRPWRKGAGYHDTQFGAACHLNRIANSPFYATNYEQAYALFMKHAPIRDREHANLRETRWQSAREATKDEFAEHPGDVPLRLPVEDIIDKYQSSVIDRLYWESTKIGQVKELIRELRLAGANEQEAYSISYEAKAMKEIRRKDPNNSASTWGYVVGEYDQPLITDEDQPDEVWGDVSELKGPNDIPVRLLSQEERAVIRNYPNFIDRYIACARTMFAEPNLPLHYLNAWVALSCGVGDRGRIHLKGKAVPLSLWGMPTADSAAGKGDSLATLESAIGGMRRGGFGDVHLGYDTSAQGLNNQLMERQGKVALLLVDEAAPMLQGFKQETSYYNTLKALALKLYDGRASRSVRAGTTREEAGESIDVTFNFWLQTTWDQLTNILDLTDVQSGLVGRFLVAVGDDAKITDESLALRFADEHQVSIGRHPMLESLVKPVRDWSAAQGKAVHSINVATKEVGDRFVKARKDVLSIVDGHPLASHLRGVMLRVTENFFKAAALLALSEGRTKVEMEDLLLALKSGEYWVRDTMRLIDAISSNGYRRDVEYVVSLVAGGPRSDAQILSSPRFKNMEKYKVSEIIARAEAEGQIVREGKKWKSTRE